MARRASRRTFCELGSASMMAWFAGCAAAQDDATASSSDTTGGVTTDDPDPTANDTTSSTSGDASGATSESSSSADLSSSESDTGTPDTSDTDDGATTGDELCEPSPDSTEGPFYRPNVPIRGNLDLYGDSGTPVHMRGRVLDGACAPVQDAIVELWHASPVAVGAEPGDDAATYDAGREFRYYGQVATDSEGRYAFDTLVPGWYLNGAQYRPAHFHVKVWAANVERLTTQLYFEDDPFNAADPWFDPAMVLVLAKDGSVDRDFVI